MNHDTNLISSREGRIAALQKLNLLSNTFMSVALQDEETCQYVLRILLGIEDLVVREVRTQYTISKITSHGAILDVLAEDSNGKIYNIEIQKRDTLDHGRRTRFYHSMIDSEFLQKGKDYDELPDVHIIYISETDLWKAGRTTYSVKKFFEGTDTVYEDGVTILYVNAAIDDGTETARMMKYFKETDPEDTSQGMLSKRVHFLKCEEGGHDTMCEVMEQFIELGREEGLEIGREQGILNLVDAFREVGISDQIILQKMQDKFKLTREEAEAYLKNKKI